MSDYHAANFGDLNQQYWGHQRTRSARKLLSRVRARSPEPDVSDEELHELLRHHEDEAIGHEDTIKRDSFDLLLAATSIMEIASLCGYIAQDLPQTFVDECLWVLSQRDVRRYYEKHYPLLLPRLFRLRLMKERDQRVSGDEEETQVLFTRFLAIVNRLLDDEEVEQFLWFLDDGSTDGFDFDDALGILRAPDRTLKALSKKGVKRRSAAEQAVSGAQKFMDFCVDFQELLDDAGRSDVLRASLWSYYSYWFGLLGEKVGPRMGQVLASLGQWVGQGSPEVLQADTAQEIVQFWHQVAAEGVETAAAYEALEGRLREADDPGSSIDAYVGQVRAVVQKLTDSHLDEPLRAAKKRSGMFAAT